MRFTLAHAPTIDHVFCFSSIPALQDLEFIEFYAGKARATLAMKQAGLKAARLDYMYFKQYDLGGGNNYFDILTDAGFASLNRL